MMRQSARPTSADRRRDFRQIDEHALSVSLADQHTFRDVIYALLNSHNLTADVDKARYVCVCVCVYSQQRTDEN